MYYQKYIKYKLKYQNTKMNIIGGFITKKFIIADGTSSSGKTTLCKHFSELGYKCITGDDYQKKGTMILEEFYKTIKNDYLPQNYKRTLHEKATRGAMIDDAIMAGKAIIDDIEQKDLIEIFHQKNLMDDVFIIIVYADLATLARNMESRRKEGDKRGIFVFDQYSKRYVKTDISDTNQIDIIKRADFKKILLKYFKYEFVDEKALNDFVERIFMNMDIEDDKSHPIKLRNEYKYDYLLKTTGKTKEEIFKELANI